METSLEFKVKWDVKSTLQGILHEYTKKLRAIVELLLMAIARSLKLKEDSFLSQYGERARMEARFNFYTTCRRPDLVLGVKPHANGSAITILLQDREVEGLQFLKDDHWVRAPIIPHALLVNVGDQVEIMSNGIFKSPTHRAVTNSEKERTTLAVFCTPEAEMEIRPVEELIDEKRLRLYKKVKNYVDFLFPVLPEVEETNRCESQCKPVQELLLNGGDPPERYIYKGGIDAASFPLIEVPVIDLSLLTSPSPARDEELGKLRNAFSSCGCIQVSSS